jgi:organic radical activating enzyme
MQLIEIKNPYRKYLNLTWIINNICTNQCSYCTPSLYAGKNHNYDWSHAEKFLEILFEKYPLVNLALSGGEPTLSPFLLDIVEKIYTRNGIVSISTNGSASLRKYLELAKYVHYFSFSYHPEYHSDDWLEKVSALAQVARVSVRVMTPANHYDASNRFFQQLKSEPRNFSFEKSIIVNRGQQNDQTFQYLESQIQDIKNQNSYNSNDNNEERFLAKFHILKDPTPSSDWIGADSYYRFNNTTEQVVNFFKSNNVTSNDLIKNNLVNFQGWQCDIGLESLFVNYTGAIKRGNCDVGGTIGHIQQAEQISWPVESIACTKAVGVCDCNVDVRISKRY